MSCTFCRKSEPTGKLASHHLCELCLAHLKCCQATSNSNRAVPSGEDAIRKVIECDVCLGEFPEDDLQEHREICMARLVFQCTVCVKEYVSKEGLWNHLDLHEIVDEKKQLHFKEVRVTHQLHKCVLCNDHRGYKERHYWVHIHEDHDGYFLRCSECGESFRSQKLKTDHVTNRCKAREQTVPLSFEDVPNSAQTSRFVDKNGEASLSFTDEAVNNSIGKDSAVLPTAAGANSQPLVEGTSLEKPNESPIPVSILNPMETKCPYCNKMFPDESILSIHLTYYHEPVDCDICGVSVRSKSELPYHKSTNHREPKFICPHCPIKMHSKISLQKHLDSHAHEVKFACEICGNMFRNLNLCNLHKKRVHPEKAAKVRVSACNQPQQGSSDASKALQTESSASSEKAQELEPTLRVPDENVGEPSTKIMDHEVVVCGICAMSFANTDQLEGHKRTCFLHTTEETESSNGAELIVMGDNSEQSHVELPFEEGSAESSCPSSNIPIATDQIKIEETSLSLIENPSNESSPLQDHKLNCSLDTGKESYSQEPTSNMDIEVDFSNAPDNNSQMSSEQNLVDHEKPNESVENSLSKTKCPDCNKECNDNLNLVYHIAFYHEQVECDICRISITNRSKLKYHKLKEHSEPQFSCPYCPKKYHIKSHFRSHHQYHHPREKIPTVLRKVPLPKKQQNETSNPKIPGAKPCNTVCPHCDEVFKDETELTQHVDNFHEPTNCGTSTGKLQDQQRNDTNENPTPTQEVASNMDAEIDTSHESRKDQSLVESFTGKCNDCDGLYQDKFELIKHIDGCHKPYICNICGVTLAGKNKYRYHKAKKHTQPKFQCPHCPVKVHFRKALEKHLTKHVSEKKFACKKCGKKYKNLCNLRAHMSRIHGVKGASKKANLSALTSTKPQQEKCNYCDRLYQDKFGLNKHINNNHTQHICTICGATITGRYNYRYHKITKHTEPKFQCTHCPVKLHFKAHLENHLTKHVSEQQFTCKVCGNKFKNQNYLSKHMRRIHGVKRAIKKTNFSVSQQESPDDSKALQTENVVSSEDPKTLETTVPISDDNDQTLVERSSSESFTAKCHYCDGLYQDKFKLKKHIENLHEPYICSICSVTITGRYNYSYHKITKHSEPKYECAHCPVKVHYKRSLVNHLTKHFSWLEFACKVCGNKYKSLNSLSKHKSRDHGASKKAKRKKLQSESSDDSNVITSDDNSGESSTEITDSESDDCIICGMSFTSTNQLEDHKRTCLSNVSQRSTPTQEIASEMDVEMESSSNKLKEVATESDPSSSNLPVPIDQIKIEETALTVAENSAGESSAQEKCFHCNRGYPNKEELIQHVRRSHEPIPCDICDIVLAGKNSYQYHKLTTHSKPKYKCPHCPKKLYHKNAYVNHVATHETKKKFPCEICGNKYKHVRDVSQHMRKSHGVKDAMKRAKAYAEKMASMPQEEDDNEEAVEWVIETADEINDKESDAKKFECPHCPKRFKSDVEVNRHIKNHHKPVTCNICGLTSNGRERNRYHKLTKHQELKHKCPQCPMKFARTQNLRVHLASHDKEKRFACKICGVKVKTLDHVEQHLRRTHRVKNARKLVEKMYEVTVKQEVEEAPSSVQCPHCPKQLDNKDKLKRHVRYTHMQMTCKICNITISGASSFQYHKRRYHTEPTIKCPRCPLKFTLKSKCLFHLASHKTEKNFLCEICGKQFQKVTYVATHMYQVHGVKGALKKIRATLAENGEQEFAEELKILSAAENGQDEGTSQELEDKYASLTGTVCPECYEECRTRPLLIRHMKDRHELITCEICKRIIFGRKQRRNHNLKYHTEPKIQCPHCPKKCHNTKSYRNHMSLHITEKKFPCELCGLKFKIPEHVSLHMSRVHRVKGAYKRVRDTFAADGLLDNFFEIAPPEGK